MAAPTAGGTGDAGGAAAAAAAAAAGSRVVAVPVAALERLAGDYDSVTIRPHAPTVAYVAFGDADVALLVGSRPRTAGTRGPAVMIPTKFSGSHVASSTSSPGTAGCCTSYGRTLQQPRGRGRAGIRPRP